MNDAVTVLVERRVTIEAAVETVFELLTDAEGLCAWIAAEATSDARPGGMLRWVHDNGAVMRGRFVELEPPTRIVFTYGWEQDSPEIPPGVRPESTRVEIDLVERNGVTHLHLVHSLLPDDVAESHGDGWSWFLERLKACPKTLK